MKKLLTRLLLFLVPIILGAWGLDAMITKGMRRSMGAEVHVWNDICEGKVRSEMVIYGTSRAVNHFDPFILQDSLHVSAYNLGVVGHNFQFSQCRQSMLEKYDKLPRIIIMSVDLFLLTKREELYNYKYLAPFLDEPFIRELSTHYVGLDWYDYHIPLVRYVGCKNEILTSIKYLTKHSVDSGAAPSHGFFPEKKDWDGTFEEVRAKEKAHVAHMNKDVCLAFDTFLGRLTSKKVKVILVYSPEYFENKSFTKNHAEILAMYKKYAQKYNIPMLDYTDDAICYDKKYFVNSTHMNVLGAQLFSQKLAHDIKEMHLADNVN